MFIFSDRKICPQQDSVKLIVVNKDICNKEALLSLYGSALGYSYGLNWDSFNDIIVEWSECEHFQEPEVWVVHEQLPDLSEEDMTTYLEILDQGCKSFRRHADGIHDLKVYFKDSDKKTVRDRLNQSTINNLKTAIRCRFLNKVNIFTGVSSRDNSLRKLFIISNSMETLYEFWIEGGELQAGEEINSSTVCDGNCSVLPISINGEKSVNIMSLKYIMNNSRKIGLSLHFFVHRRIHTLHFLFNANETQLSIDGKCM